MEANDTQGQLALGVWYTTEQDDERAGKWWSGDVLLRNGCWNVELGTTRRGSWEYSTTTDKA